MIKIAGKELLYSTSVVLFAGETALITPPDLPGSVIEVTVVKERDSTVGLESGLNDAKLKVAADDGISTSIFGLHTPHHGILEGRIVAQSIFNMTRFDIQLIRKFDLATSQNDA